MKVIKRIWFVVLVLINLIIFFIPEMFYWLFKGHGFLSDRLNRIYAKWILPLLFLLISCEKPIDNTCKECTFVEDNQIVTVFVCGEELQKYERDNIKCIIPDKKKDGIRKEKGRVRKATQASC